MFLCTPSLEIIRHMPFFEEYNGSKIADVVGCLAVCFSRPLFSIWGDCLSPRTSSSSSSSSSDSMTPLCLSCHFPFHTERIIICSHNVKRKKKVVSVYKFTHFKTYSAVSTLQIKKTEDTKIIVPTNSHLMHVFACVCLWFEGLTLKQHHHFF